MNSNIQNSLAKLKSSLVKIKEHNCNDYDKLTIEIEYVPSGWREVVMETYQSSLTLDDLSNWLRGVYQQQLGEA